MGQITALVLNDGTNSVTFDPLRCNGSGQASFRNNTLGQDNLKDMVHVNTTTNSNGTRKGTLDVIRKQVSTDPTSGLMTVVSTVNITVSVSFPSQMPAVERAVAYGLAASAMTQLADVLRDGTVLY